MCFSNIGYSDNVPQQAVSKGHHLENGFQNDPYIETAASKGALFYLRRFWSSVFVPDIPEGHSLSADESIKLLHSLEGDRISWLGHASFLIHIDGKTILTDPFLEGFASPLSWAGPRRFVPSGIPTEKLPPIDVILVSHNHYDHLDEKTIEKLVNKEKIHVVVPLGLKSFFTKRGYEKVSELDWHQKVQVDELTIIAQPAVHDSARSLSDHNKTLWSSWVIESPTKKIYFVGDSGYSDSIFKQVGEDHGPFDVAIVPIGAYEPRELMWMSHVNPEEAVQIGIDVRANTLIASHWGTVSSLSDEPIWEPPRRFKAAGFAAGFSDQNLWSMKVGETRSVVKVKHN
ncbi:MAG: MBL fold metallo-hydrolase [Gammaproteobacteria bacterium]|nr:MBL fold metallo-hydrolase [Gammaproteobacteria bacterium]